MEEWKIIDNTKGDYKVSCQGNVMSKRNKNKDWVKINPTIGKNGYKYITIHFDNEEKRRKVYIHRLVAIYFLKKQNNCTEVNHINSNRVDNRVENLEWVTSSGNTEHAVKNKRLVPWNNPRKPIIAINLKTNERIEFESISKAEIYFNSRHIVNVLKGTRNTCKGHTFMYK